MYITSKPISIFSHASLSDVIGLPATSALVNCIAPISAGIRIGKFRIGSITSRSRMFTVSALKIVPITVIAHVPSTTTSINCQNCEVQRTL